MVTVDPARRLADALGRAVAAQHADSEVEGDWPGQLHALMLDPKGTFDDLVQRYARTPEQAEVILANRLYQNLTGALSGTQEYMAMEKLYELVESSELRRGGGRHPADPQRPRLPRRPPPPHPVPREPPLPGADGADPGGARAVGVAAQALLRTISKVAGAEIVQDAVAFFQAFEGMEEGFRSRAGAVHELLADPATAFVLVTSARPDPIDRGRLLRRASSPSATSPSPPWWSTGSSPASPAADRRPPAATGPRCPLRSRRWSTNLAELNTLAATGRSGAFAGLVAQVAPAPVGRVPLLGQRRARR